MKSLKTIILLIAAFSVTLFAVEHSQAQDARAEAIQMYNQAQDLAGSGDFENAIDVYKEALDIARENQLDDIIELAEQRIPRVAQSRATNEYRAYQNQRTLESANNALDAFKEARDIAEEFGDDEVMQRATGAIPQLYYIRSVLQFRADNYEAALADLDTAIELNENYAAAYYQKAVVLKKQNPEDIDTALEWYDRAIDVAQRTNNNKTLNNAREGASEELIYRAVNLADDRQFSRAIELLEKVEKYNDQSADAHFRLAAIYNERGNWNEALQHAEKALEFESGGVTERAKIYFELGTAYKGIGEVNDACDAFENARYGDFTEPANHELQFELKCEGHAPTGRK